MNMLKKGPEIKLSELKVPGFLSDLYWDLRDRHLLPIVAVLAIAIVAAPILLSQSSSDPEAPTSNAAPPATAGAQSGFVVAKSAPGLRHYQRRLDQLQPKDPFSQPGGEEAVEASASTAAAPEEGSTAGNATEAEFESTGAAESPSEGAVEPSPKPSPHTEGGGNESGSTPAPENPNLKYYSYAIDVRVISPDKQKTVRRDLPELTMLPSRETPAAVYMGSTKDGKKALMLISSDVHSVFGDAKCVLGSTSCELLAMETGVPETFVYGGAGKTYKIELLKIGLIATEKLDRAPLGEPKKSKSAGRAQLSQALAQPR